VYEELKTAHTLYERLKNVHKLDSDSDMEAVPFEGDAFGSAEDYANDTFGQDMPDEPPQSEEELEEPEEELEEEELEEDDIAEFENTWEPDREGAPMDGREGEDMEGPNDSDEDDEADDEAGARRTAERILVGDGHGVKPAVVLCYTDKYPSSGAGGVLGHGVTADNRYSAAVSGQENPFAPFKSRMDWEVALWAKLRGPGSTAFSDLLSVAGVSLKAIILIIGSENIELILNRFVKASICHTRTQIN